MGSTVTAVDWLLALVPVLSFAAGAAAQLGGEALRDRRLTAREEAAAARAQARDDQQAAREFERETLLELQDAAKRWARMIGRAQHAAHVHVRRDGGTAQSLELPPEVDEGLLATGVEVDRLGSRVASAEVAERLSWARKNALEVTLFDIGGRDLAHADEHMSAFATELEELNRAIGARLREVVYGQAERV